MDKKNRNKHQKGMMKKKVVKAGNETAKTRIVLLDYLRWDDKLCTASLHERQVPSANAIFFNGDRVQGTRNPVIERLSDLQNVADILVSKFGASTNAWVVEASVFNGPFAVYADFIPSVNRWGEPRAYNAEGFPASTSTVFLLLNCLEEARRNTILRGGKGLFVNNVDSPSSDQPKTYILGFSKGGTVLNQLVTELGFSGVQSQQKEQSSSGDSPEAEQQIQIIPCTKEALLNSITAIHYVDAGLNSAGAYITDSNVIEEISKRLARGAPGIRFVLHGTPRQWCDSRRALTRSEKDRLLRLLESAAQKSGGRLQVCEKFYFADRPPDLQMHFEIIECMDIS